MKLSTLLHQAADEYLIVDDPNEGYSCRAVWNAIDNAWYSHKISTVEKVSLSKQFEDGVEALGLDWGSFLAFSDIPPETRQAARYQWLKFCALLAEEQGE